MTLRDIFDKIFAEKGLQGSVICKVLSVQGDIVEVEPLDGTASFSARLQADEVAGLKLTPADNSIVIVAFSNKNNVPYVALFSRIKKAEMIVQEKIKIANQTASLGSLLQNLISAIEDLTVPTPAGPSGVPVNILQFTAIKTQLQNLLES
jgi:hypothetical protein